MSEVRGWRQGRKEDGGGNDRDKDKEEGGRGERESELGGEERAAQ